MRLSRVPTRPLLALDTATPVVSVALAVGERIVAERQGAQKESSRRLVDWIDEVLREGGIGLAGLEGAVALCGPGSFTGLRVGLATLLGFHQAIALPVAGLPTLAVLAAAVPPGEGAVAALVPAGPAEWFVQSFAGRPPVALGEPRRLPAGELSELSREDAARLVVATQAEADRLPALGRPVHVAGPLAAVAARLAALDPPAWDAAALRAPLYLAPAPVSLPGAPKPVLPLATEPRR